MERDSSFVDLPQPAVLELDILVEIANGPAALWKIMLELIQLMDVGFLAERGAFVVRLECLLDIFGKVSSLPGAVRFRRDSV